MNDFQPKKPWTVFTTALAFVARPRRSFSAVATNKSLAEPLAFTGVLFIVCAALRAVALLIVGVHPGISALLSPILMELLWFVIAAGGLHLALRAVRRTSGPLGATLRLMAYSLSPWLFSALWILLPGMAGEIALLLILLAILGLLFAGLRSVYDLTPPLAAAVIIIDMVFVLLLTAVVQQIGIGA